MSLNLPKIFIMHIALNEYQSNARPRGNVEMKIASKTELVFKTKISFKTNITWSSG